MPIQINHIKLISPTIFSIVLAICIGLWSCSGEDDFRMKNQPDENVVEGIYLSVSPISMAQTRDPGKYDEGVEDIDSLIPYSLEFDKNSIVQVSQRTEFPKRDPFTLEENIYNFEYNPDAADASWDNEDSYNFWSRGQKNPLDWSSIAVGGQSGGGFALFSLYFPIENQLRRKTLPSGAIIYNVMEDQSSLENLMKSDILGAYHSTTKIFTRIKFKMHHLMTYVRVRLYVPLYREDKKTGYREGALSSATINNVSPYFTIDWNAQISSDIQSPQVKPYSDMGNITMYQHPLEPGMTSHPITTLHNVKDAYLGEGYFDQELENDEDQVRVYDFSVLIPVQSELVDENNNKFTFTQTNFLTFAFRTNSGAETTYYFNQSLSATSNESKFDMTQGKFQYLELYVPRIGNKLIYFGANVKPWDDMNAGMDLKEKTD